MIKMDAKQVKQIIELYETQCKQLEDDEWDWRMDEDNTGIPYPYKQTKEQIYETIAARYNFLNRE